MVSGGVSNIRVLEYRRISRLAEYFFKHILVLLLYIIYCYIPHICWLSPHWPIIIMNMGMWYIFIDVHRLNILNMETYAYIHIYILIIILTILISHIWYITIVKSIIHISIYHICENNKSTLTSHISYVAAEVLPSHAQCARGWWCAPHSC